MVEPVREAVTPINADIRQAHAECAEELSHARAAVFAIMLPDGSYKLFWGGSNRGDHHMLAVGILSQVMLCHQ